MTDASYGAFFGQYTATAALPNASSAGLADAGAAAISGPATISAPAIKV